MAELVVGRCGRICGRHCSACPHRSPPTTARDLSQGDDAIYAPLLERFPADAD
jgi:hypothetical protein